MKLKWSRKAGWTAIAVAALCAATLAFLVGTTALDKDAGLLPKAFLFSVGVVAVVATLAASDGAPWSARRRLPWLQPRPIAVVFLAIFVAFGVMTDALSLIEPRAAQESAPRLIEHNVGKIKADVGRILAKVEPRAAAAARIRTAIVGLWGEEGCAAVFRFAIRGDALIVTGERQPPGTPPYREVSEIISAEGNVMTTVGESAGGSRGRAATFTYSTNGVTERLVWADRTRPPALEYQRCG